MLCHFSGLTKEEANIFTDLSEIPHDPKSEVTPIYNRAEQKVGNSYDGSTPDLWEKQSEMFNRQLRMFLSTVYSPSEINDLFSLIKQPVDCDLIVRDIIGSDDPLIRRIRNTYLPKITDVFSLNYKTGLITDETQKVFKDPGDPVSNIERVLGITQAKALVKIYPKSDVRKLN